MAHPLAKRCVMYFVAVGDTASLNPAFVQEVVFKQRKDADKVRKHMFCYCQHGGFI